MGTPQPARGYVQHTIAFLVLLIGLTYSVIESYIDDIVVRHVLLTKDKLFENLKLIFERFRKHMITFNPDKVHLSDSKMEFVGHEFTHDGIQFSKNKKNGVNNIPIPTTKGDLKKFLGVANYFRDHVRNHSMLAAPTIAATGLFPSTTQPQTSMARRV